MEYHWSKTHFVQYRPQVGKVLTIVGEMGSGAYKNVGKTIKFEKVFMYSLKSNAKTQSWTAQIDIRLMAVG